MKILRSLPTFLAIVAALGVLAFAAVMSPPVQTWYVRRLLARQADWHVDVEEVFAGFSQVEITRLRVERGGLLLTAPSVRLDLPVWQALRERRLAIRRLVAKDWTLKIVSAAKPAPAAGAPAASSTTAPAASTTPPTAAEAHNFAGIISSWTLPCAVSVDDAAIEGDLLSPQDETTSSLHLAVTGGGVGPGRTGNFALVAKAYDARLPENAIAVQADVAVTSDDGRSVRRIEVKGGLASGAGTRVVATAGAAWNFRLTAERGASAESYQLAVEREGRSLAELHGGWDPAAGRFGGDWSVGLRDGDAAALGLGTLLPKLLDGGGKFTATPDFASLAATGKVRTAAHRWPAVADWLAVLGPTTLTAEFDLVGTPAAVHFAALTLALDGVRPLAALRAVQPFDFVLADHGIRATEPTRDWAELELRGWPLAWFAGKTGATTFDGGDLTGRLALGVDGGVWRTRTLSPLRTEGVTLHQGDRVLAKALTVQAGLKAQVGPAANEWQLELSPLTLASGSANLARLDAKFVRPATRDEPVAVSGKWTLALAAIKASGTVPGLGWLTASYAAGDVKGTLGGYADLLLQTTIAGADDTHAASGAIRVDLYGEGSYAIAAPLTLTFGRSVSELRIDWEWRADEPKTGIDVKIAGKKVVLDHLRPLAVPLAAIGHGDVGGGVGAGKLLPFWGDWIGRARVDIDRLQLSDRELIDIGGYLKIAPDRIELLGGHGGAPERSMAQVDATLTFDPTKAEPYALKATMAPYRREAEEIFGVPAKDKDPIFTGRFEVQHSLTATGASLAALIARREDEYQLSGGPGIVRLLKPGVRQALPPAPDTSGVVNTLDNVGTGFLRILGANTKSLSSGEIKVRAEKESVLDFDSSMAEIGYDSLKLTAVLRADGVVRVTQFDLLGSDVHLAGAGALGGGAEAGWLERPLSAELTLGVKGRMGDLLKKAGLLSGKKDAADYEIVEPAIKFGGTLKQLTQDEWRARLAAAAQKPAAKTAK